jgi:ATP-binding protein involved in chromosome partitioning
MIIIVLLEVVFMNNSQPAISSRMSKIRHKILVLSGKGGVGKSTVAVNLAVSLTIAGKRTGLLDVDIHGPSIPKMLALVNRPVQIANQSLIPLEIDGLKVMSIAFLLPDQRDAVIWRGPMKMEMIRQFLTIVDWGDLDFLIIDSPPGTGDEPLSICQLVEKPDGAIIVTTPQEVALDDVRKSISFCNKLNMPVLGVIENMSGFICPKCGEETRIFKTGGGEKLAQECNVPFLGAIPIDPQIGEACDSGQPYLRNFASSRTALVFKKALQPVLDLA